MFRSPEQENFSSLVTSHMAKSDAPLLLEGATGLGKTRAYLAAVMQSANRGKKIAIVLPTHQLIDQLLASSDLAITQQNGLRVKAFRPRSKFDTTAEYRTCKSEALEAEVMVCTSASVVIDQRLKGEYNRVTKRDYIVFDEADQLPDAAELQISCEIKQSQLKDLGIEVESAEQAATAILRKKDLEPEVKAAALMILEAIDEPAWFHQAGVTDDGGIMLYHKMPGRLLKRIANRNEVAFISATLSINDCFDDFKRSLGIQKQSDLSSIIEPGKHGNLHFDVADVEVNTPEWLESIKKTVELAKGRVLVATPSHELANLLGELIPGSTVRDSSETASQAAARMGDDKVLIAAGAWAGLDAPLQWGSIVVPRIPYERPVTLDGNIESSFLNTRNTAIRRMRQVIGRGLRNPQAECSIYILDGRYKNIEAFVPARFRADWQAKGVLEGGRREVTITLSKIERDPSVRKKAFAHYGTKCMACEFSPRVLSQIDVHHLNPIAEGGERLTSINDVAVLCSNCHRLAHSNDPPFAVNQLREMNAPVQTNCISELNPPLVNA